MTISYRELCRRRNAHSIKYRKRLKNQVFAAYGGYLCACCGETEHAFLTIDHIHNNGADERRWFAKAEKGKGSSSTQYAWLKKLGYPPGYRVLCMNCNRGRWVNGGTCPHEAQTHAFLGFISPEAVKGRHPLLRAVEPEMPQGTLFANL